MLFSPHKIRWYLLLILALCLYFIPLGIYITSFFSEFPVTFSILSFFHFSLKDLSPKLNRLTFSPSVCWSRSASVPTVQEGEWLDRRGTSTGLFVPGLLGHRKNRTGKADLEVRCTAQIQRAALCGYFWIYPSGGAKFWWGKMRKKQSEKERWKENG